MKRTRRDKKGKVRSIYLDIKITKIDCPLKMFPYDIRVVKVSNFNHGYKVGDWQQTNEERILRLLGKDFDISLIKDDEPYFTTINCWAWWHGDEWVQKNTKTWTKR